MCLDPLVLIVRLGPGDPKMWRAEPASASVLPPYSLLPVQSHQDSEVPL